MLVWLVWDSCSTVLWVVARWDPMGHNTFVGRKEGIWDKLNRILDAYKIMCETANLPVSMAQEATDLEDFITNHLESLND